MFFVQLTPTRDSTSELLDALRQREVAVFGPSTPGRTRTPNEGNGKPKRNIFFGNLLICIADQHRGSCSAMNRGSWSSRSSSTAAAAQQQWWRRRRVAIFGPSTPGPTRTPSEEMEHRSGTFFRDSLYIMHCGSALRTAEAAAHQKQHSSSGGSDVAATNEKDERGYTGEPFVFVLALSRNLKRTSTDTPRSLLLTTAVLLCR